MTKRLSKMRGGRQVGGVWIVVLVSIAISGNSRAPAEENKPSPSVVMLQSGDRVYRIRYGERLQVDFAPAQSLAADQPGVIAFNPVDAFPLALSGRRVDSVVAAPWAKRCFILALRLHDAQNSRFSYCWAALVDGRWWAGEIGLTTPDREIPYEARDIGNDLRGGDTISMHWTRAHAKQNGGGPGEDLLYVNECPGNSNLGPLDLAQKLYRVRHDHESLEEVDLTKGK